MKFKDKIKEMMAPDVKQYKKIIKEIMGLEAKKMVSRLQKNIHRI